MLKQFSELFRELLANKLVLYFTLFAAMCNIFLYVIMHEFDAVVFFLIIGLLTSYFSKNMIIILLSAMAFTFAAVLIKIGTQVHSKFQLEGFANDEDEEEEGAHAQASAQASGSLSQMHEDELVTEGMNARGKRAKKMMRANAAKAKASGAKAGGAKASGAKAGGAKASGAKAAAAARAKAARAQNLHEEFLPQLQPASVADDDLASDHDHDASEDEEGDGVKKHKPKINYASTLESAYDNLDKLLSSTALQNMSKDTQRLATKQQNLMGNIEKLEPMIKTASGLLDNLNVDGIADKILGFQKQFGMSSASGSASASASGKENFAQRRRY